MSINLWFLFWFSLLMDSCYFHYHFIISNQYTIQKTLKFSNFLFKETLQFKDLSSNINFIKNLKFQFFLHFFFLSFCVISESKLQTCTKVEVFHWPFWTLRVCFTQLCLLCCYCCSFLLMSPKQPWNNNNNIHSFLFCIVRPKLHLKCLVICTVFCSPTSWHFYQVVGVADLNAVIPLRDRNKVVCREWVFSP